MPGERRIRVDGVAIGCPVVHGEGSCPHCGGGWPGTRSPSRSLIREAREGTLNPALLGCGNLQAQAEFLIKKFAADGHDSPDIMSGSEES